MFIEQTRDTLISYLDKKEYEVRDIDRKHISIFNVVGLVLVEVVDAIDRRDDGSGAAHGSLVEIGKFLNRHRTDLDLQTQVACHLLDGHVGDGRQDGLRVGSDVGVAIDAEEVGRTTLVDKLSQAG